MMAFAGGLAVKIERDYSMRPAIYLSLETLIGCVCASMRTIKPFQTCALDMAGKPAGLIGKT
jgi:hypothetical protein